MNKAIGAIIDRMIAARPDVARNPKAMEALEAIKSGDAQKGQEIAKAICQQRGQNPQDATNEASTWFNTLTGNGQS